MMKTLLRCDDPNAEVLLISSMDKVLTHTIPISVDDSVNVPLAHVKDHGVILDKPVRNALFKIHEISYLYY